MMKNIKEYHAIKPKVRYLLIFASITSPLSLTDFFVEEIQLPPINHGVGFEP